ncbi:kinase [Hirsutella rhossiliensis]|uniref:Autophagy-related protein 1 n=1 Tax=Hirsutella rhossiliensis TaxID=111463 RepID=A0A9P8MVC6_9HYPO|nr:kinase [Hirsutella rhossiliensis]KAH0961839.1 kinase [Hirsutella rhossiliensis]
MQKEPGIFIVLNLSRHGTLTRAVDSSTDPGFTRVKSQRAFGTYAGVSEMTIQLGELTVKLSCPDYSSYRYGFEDHWSKLYAELSAQVPTLNNLALSAGPSSTHNSIEYYLNGRIGDGDGGCVYRAVNRVTGDVYAVKRYWSSKDVRKEVALLSRIQHEHIVEFHSYSEATNELVLEYVCGLTLRMEHAKMRFNMLELKLFSKQALDALSYLHEKHENLRWNASLYCA